jgi:hypothetical protein
MKSLLLPPPPLVLGSALEVLPRPLDPMADEVEPVEFEAPELDDEEDEVEGVLPVVVVLPSRLVAAVNADDAFDAGLLTGEPEELELELEDEAVDVLLALEVDEESRP